MPVLPLDSALEFAPEHDAEFFASLPARPAVFLIEPASPAARPFLSRTADLRRRLERLLGVPDTPSRRLNLRELAARVRYRLTGSPFEQSLLLYECARKVHPARYRDFLRLRHPALLKLNLRSEYPRCYVTRRVLADGALYVGPFASRRSANALAREFLNFFKLRRCQIRIRRDPAFPGCIYSELKMCLAPCFAGCTKAEYDAEVVRLREFLESCGASLEAQWATERDAASEALDFERAALLHGRMEKLAGVLRAWPELPREISRLDALLVQPAAEPQAVALFRVRGGFLDAPRLLRFAELQSEPRSVEQLLRDLLNESPLSPAGTRDVRDLSDHLSLLARWYYGKPRIGEIYFPQTSRRTGQFDWPYRRIIRGCSKILGAAPAPPA